jgi:hypothetical protein
VAVYAFSTEVARMDLESKCLDLLDEIEEFEERLGDTMKALQAHKRRLREIMVSQWHEGGSLQLLEEVQAFLDREGESI